MFWRSPATIDCELLTIPCFDNLRVDFLKRKLIICYGNTVIIAQIFPSDSTFQVWLGHDERPLSVPNDVPRVRDHLCRIMPPRPSWNVESRSLQQEANGHSNEKASLTVEVQLFGLKTSSNMSLMEKSLLGGRVGWYSFIFFPSFLLIQFLIFSIKKVKFEFPCSCS